MWYNGYKWIFNGGRRMKKRLISTLLTIAIFASLLPAAFAANTVTRAEWISQLVEAFSMTVEDDSAMPDNYFSDISETDSYYRDILLAVEFGVIDLEAGEAFEPNEPANREFAARTLNSCLQFQLDEGAEYTYSESGSVTYPDDIQIAVNRNWFALSGGNFLPEQAVTTQEATAMLADAKSVIDSEAIDTSYNNQFEFADGVIVIPETAQTTIDENNTVTITDNETEINADDIFVVFSSGIPIALKATAVEITDNITVISATKEGAENAIVSVDYESVSEVDLENFVADEVETYSITNTSTGENEEMEIQLYSIGYDEKTKTLKASKNIKVGGGLAGSISVEVKNIKLHHKEDVKKGVYKAYITGDTTVTESISFDFGEYAGIPHSILLGIVPIEGIGDVSLELDISLQGGMTCTEIGEVKSGFCYERYSGFRLIANYNKKEFSYTAEANIKVGLTLSANINLIVVSGRAWATIGVHGYYKKHRYNDGMPILCETIGAYLYANYGAKVTITGVDANVFDKKVDIWTEENSPVRVYYHYESGARVDACTREAENTDARVKYTTHTNSAYFNPSPNRGQSSYGGSGSGSTVEPVVIWEYEVDNDGNATITKYKGNASAVAVPSKIDGYTVTKIGSSAFIDNKTIRSVTIPNSVTSIGDRAFASCNNLESVYLSRSLSYLGGQAFGSCTKLNNIEIPKSLTTCDWTGSSNIGGPFYNCSGLKNVTFEDNTTAIPQRLFMGCTGIEQIEIPDTVTEIKSSAFENATNLKNITISDSVTAISGSTFEDCTSLREISIPDSVTNIKGSAFKNCTSLSNVMLSKNLEILEHGAFQGCKALTSIKIPKNVQDTYSYANPTSVFYNSGLKEVTFEEGITRIPAHLFAYAYELESVEIPDTVTSIGYAAFRNCIGLRAVKIPNSVTEISGEAFIGCTSLKEVSLPDSITSMGDDTFSGCTSLEKVKLPNTRQNIMSGTFYNCKKLTDIELPNTVTAIRNGAFYGCEILKNLTLPDGVQVIENSAFENCKTLENIEIPKNVTSIGSSAFKNCASLQTAVVNGSGSIGSQAFYNCDSLTSLTLGDGVTSIGIELCHGCDKLSEVKLGKYIENIPDSAFRLCQSLTTVTLPRFCKTVAANAFAEDVKLVSAYVPNTVTKIENNSFSYPAKMTMYGKSGSYAEEYAKSRNMTFNGTAAPIIKFDYVDNSIDIGRRDYIRPALNIEPSFDTSTITFASSDEKICTVSETGEIYGNNYGTATITVSSDSGVKDTITVNVVRLADSVSLDKTELELETGDTAKLTATLSPFDATDKITWKSSNENVATVDNGTVTAVGAGTAVITVTTTGGKTASCTVKVTGTFTVTATAGENGTISPSGEVPVKSDAKATFNILPDYGYVVKDVLVNGTSVGAVESYTFSNLTDNATITAEFAKVNTVYENNTITISSEAALKDLELIVATYDDDGILTDCEIKTVTTNASENYTETIPEANNVKLMLWNGLDTMRPIWCSR